jgi:tRNA-specific adenosine deaminase 1
MYMYTSLHAPWNGVLTSMISALCWLADSSHPYDVLISGLKRGVPPKHRHNPRFRSVSKVKIKIKPQSTDNWSIPRPRCSKICLFQLYRHTLSILRLPLEPWVNYQDPFLIRAYALMLCIRFRNTATYFECKQSISEYQAAKQALMGETGPFSGWIKSGKQWESFSVDEDCQVPGCS